MRKKTVCIFLILMWVFSVKAEIKVFFSPSNDCENEIIDLINNSQKTIDIAVYAINNRNIVKALEKAHRRGIKLRILTDKSQASLKSSKARQIFANGINIKVHTKYKSAHDKFAIFDDAFILTGSYNWTNAASKQNTENCIFLLSEPEIVKKYQNRFNELWSVNSEKKSKAWFNGK